MPQYSQWSAMFAVCKAALRAIFKSPQAIFFSLFFPVVLIMVFGALTGRGGLSMDVAFDKNSDTTNFIYSELDKIPGINFKRGTEADIQDRLSKGRLTALINIQKQTDSNRTAEYSVDVKTTDAARDNLGILQQVLSNIINVEYKKEHGGGREAAIVNVVKVNSRPYRMIDFYLPGMLGFSLIGSAVFGVAFVFYSLRETLVLKRMFATPVKKGYIVLGESIARVIFQLVTAIVLILFGKYVYDFTLANGWITFFELLFLSFLGLVVFMGFGFIISSIAKNQNVIPIYANLFMFPQYFLSGTFFPKSLLPAGMQAVINYLPLTAMNDAMRKVSFEGMHLGGVSSEIIILSVWCVVVYAILFKVFKWE